MFNPLFMYVIVNMKKKFAHMIQILQYTTLKFICKKKLQSFLGLFFEL